MKVGDICIVKDTGRTVQHPEGSRVRVVLITSGDERPYYCQAEDGRTCYYYGEEDLEVVEREGLI